MRVLLITLFALWYLPAFAQAPVKEVFRGVVYVPTPDSAGGLCFYSSDNFLNNPKVVHLSKTGTLTTTVTQQDIVGLGPQFRFHTPSNPAHMHYGMGCDGSGTTWNLISNTKYMVSSDLYSALLKKTPNQPLELSFDARQPITMPGKTMFAAAVREIAAAYGRLEGWVGMSSDSALTKPYGHIVWITGPNRVEVIHSGEVEKLGDFYHKRQLTRNAVWVPVEITASGYWKLYRFTPTGEKALMLEGFVPARKPLIGIAGNSRSIILQNRVSGGVEYVQLEESNGKQVWRGLPEATYQGLTESGSHYMLDASGRLHLRLPGQSSTQEVSLPIKPTWIMVSEEKIYLFVSKSGLEGTLYELDPNSPVFKVTANLPEAKVGQSYLSRLTASGGTPPYQWQILSGNLPPNLTLNSEGTISGTTFAPGAYTFTVSATDRAGGIATAQLTLSVKDGVIPEFSASSVVNGASFLPGISPGAIATIFGHNLNPMRITAENTTDPMAEQLNGTELLVNGRPAPLFHLVSGKGGSDQLTFQVPHEAAFHTKVRIQVRIQTSSGPMVSKEVEVETRPYSPALFLFTHEATTYGTITNAEGQIAGKDVSQLAAGDIGSAWCTGLGPTMPGALTSGKKTPGRAVVPTMPRLTFSGIEAEVIYAGATEGFVGLYQINFRMPEVPKGMVRTGTIEMGGYESEFRYF